MATIKSYADLQQSKKLAEILPLESADMHYHYDSDFDELESIPSITEEDDHFVLFPKDIRCWSLAALLDVFPKGTRLLKSTTDDTYHCDCPKENIDKWFDNSVDACYEMILKLQEQKIL